MKRFLLLAGLAVAAAAPVMAISPSADMSASAAPASRAFVPGPEAPFAPVLSETASPLKTTELAALLPKPGKIEKADSAPLTPKSPRKAFFLSLLVPGLGEYYAGSNRGVFFLAAEAAGWYAYHHYTEKGEDFEDKYEAYADANWRYSSDSGYNYRDWLKYQLNHADNGNGIPYDATRFDDYSDLAGSAYMDTLITNLINTSSRDVSHVLPGTKTQQYYEMIGKYPEFVYGWADIAECTAALADTSNLDYSVNVRNVKSNMCNHYESLRHDSNTNLKNATYGVNFLILNRIVSAIDAARIAYHRNQGLNSELSMIRVNFVQKQVLDNRVPMLIVSKQF